MTDNYPGTYGGGIQDLLDTYRPYRPEPVDPDTGETTTERELFHAAVEAALRESEIAKAIEDYFSADDVSAHIEQNRALIWEKVAPIRTRWRDAEQALSLAEQATWDSQLDPDEEATWEQQLHEMHEAHARLRSHVDQLRIAAQKPRIDTSVLRAKAALDTAVAGIEREQATRGLEGNLKDLGSADQPTLDEQTTTNVQESQSRGLPRTSKINENVTEREYQKALERLTKAGRALSDFATANLRRELAQGPPLRAAINRDATCQAARQALDSTQELLARQLFLDGTLPVASAFVNERASHLYETEMRIPETSGLYDSLIQSSPFVTPAIQKVDRVLHRMTGASVGIGGPRGAGKTTLIEYFCRSTVGNEYTERATIRASRPTMDSTVDTSDVDTSDEDTSDEDTSDEDRNAGGQEDKSWIRLLVSAPVEYVPLDFILYLLSELCRSILGTTSDDQTVYLEAPQPENEKHALTLARQWFLPTVAISALLAAAVITEIALLKTAVHARIDFAVAAISMMVMTIFFAQIIRPPGLSRSRRRFTTISYLLLVVVLGLWLSAILIPALNTTIDKPQYALLLAYLVLGLLVIGWPPAPSTDSITSRIGQAIVSAPGLASVGATAALVALQFSPALPALALAGSITLAAAATLSFAAHEAKQHAYTDRYRISHSRREGKGADDARKSDDQRNDDLAANRYDQASFLLGALRNILMVGGTAAIGLAYYRGELNYLIISAIGLVAIGAMITTRIIHVTDLRSGFIGPRRHGLGRRSLRTAISGSRRPGVGDVSVADAVDSGPTDSNQQNSSSILATQLLREIEYLETSSTGRSRTWKTGITQIPVGFEAASTRGTSWARQPWSAPAAVERFKMLADSAAQDYGRVIIGIDELDKIEYDRAARFLNDIKAVFGVRGSYFLVSVSENAAAGFERRGVPFRDAFDSSFDDVITVGYLDWQTSRALLNTRVVGMHAPFAALCYVFSGGLARDLIRTARTLFSYGDADGALTLSYAVQMLCHEEMQGKIRGICRELADRHDDVLAMDLLVHVQASDVSFETAQQYLQWSEYVGDWIHGLDLSSTSDIAARDRTAVRYAGELAVFGYFVGTISEFFDEQLSRTRFTEAVAENNHAGSIWRLAAARQAMAVSPMMSEKHIVGFRRAWSLKTPRPVSGSTEGNSAGAR
jgi:hypothetical protein